MVHVFVHLVFISRVHSDFQNLQSCSVPHAGGLHWGERDPVTRLEQPAITLLSWLPYHLNSLTVHRLPIVWDSLMVTLDS